jgi:CRISPR-associated exonuclease Cas4
VLHEINEEKSKRTEISIDNIKIDKLTRDYLVEVKKSDSDVEAVKWQVLLYLYKLKQKGVEKKGKVEFIEKNRQSKKVQIIELDEKNEAELLEVLEAIEKLINLPKTPEAQFKKHCKKCAYYEYCFI